jgi:hypothetical protein
MFLSRIARTAAASRLRGVTPRVVLNPLVQHLAAQHPRQVYHFADLHIHQPAVDALPNAGAVGLQAPGQDLQPGGGGLMNRPRAMVMGRGGVMAGGGDHDDEPDDEPDDIETDSEDDEEDPEHPNVELRDKKNKTLGELDGVRLKRNKAYEDKSALGLKESDSD